MMIRSDEVYMEGEVKAGRERNPDYIPHIYTYTYVHTCIYPQWQTCSASCI